MLGFLTVLPNDYRISEPYYYLKPFVEILFTTMSGDKSTPSTKALYDPGWNDPPSYSYDARKTKSKGYSLTKRVAYSLDDTEQQPKQVTLTIPPKMCPADHPPIIPMNKPSAGILHETTNNEAETVVECSSVLGNFFVVLNEVYGDANEKEYSEIRKRLTIMEKMWSEQKFPVLMRQKLHNISEGLIRNDFDACDNLQRSIMVDYTSLSSSWMPAIRLLINSKRSKLNR